jgi:glycerophosphoryl diester phosphodiesterase
MKIGPYIRSVPLILFLAFAGCSQDPDIAVPQFSDGGRIAGTLPISRTVLESLNGVYAVEKGTEQLGKLVVIKRSGKGLSIFTGKNAGLFVLDCGMKDSSLYFDGYWRYTQGSETGLAQFEVPAGAESRSLLSGTAASSSLVITGALGLDSELPGTKITLRYQRPLGDSTFLILAHRGGGRNSDRLPESENSLGIIEAAERYGSNGIEIDVRLTKDGVPILFHDENFSPRLVNSDYCIGPVSNFTFASVRTLATLKNGEVIPTLKEALDVVLTKTELTTVWFDIKSPDALRPAEVLQREYKTKAAQSGRKLNIYLGLASDEMMAQYRKGNYSADAEVLCELSAEQVRSVNARIWAPRWTLGPMPEETSRLRAEGRKTIVWTLDQREFILPFLTGGKIDGILTNYPALVAFEYYVFH